jgi:hypothetical protein
LGELGQVLGGHPLALTLAARRILKAKPNPSQALAQHLKEYQTKLPTGVEFTQLKLNQAAGKPTLPYPASSTPNSITTAKGKLQVFLCHASTDKPAVIALYNRLSSYNWIRPWLDSEDLIAGQDWQLEIPKAVRQSDVVLVCLSANSINKAGYVQKEIKYALDVADEKPEGAIYLIPLRLEDCVVPERLSKPHWVDYFKEDGFNKLLKALSFQAKLLGIDSLIDVPIAESSTLQAIQSPLPLIRPVPSPTSPVPLAAEVKTKPTRVAATVEDVEVVRARLESELESLHTGHLRRKQIGEQLDKLAGGSGGGDTRSGVGVVVPSKSSDDGVSIPDIAWLAVTPGGQLEIGEYGKCEVAKIFYIAKYPITYGQYAAFVQAEDGYHNPQWWEGMPPEYQRSSLAEQKNRSKNAPRDNVTWYQSVAFSRWLNAHLEGLELELPNLGTSTGKGASGNKFILGQNAEVRCLWSGNGSGPHKGETPKEGIHGVSGKRVMPIRKRQNKAKR